MIDRCDATGISHSPLAPSPFEACCAILIPVTFARVTARYILSQSGTIGVTSRPSCRILVIRCDCATPPLTRRKVATTPFLASFTLANSERNGVGTMESIIMSHSRTTAYPYLSFALSTPSYTPSLDMLVLSSCLPRSSHRRAALLLQLVEHDLSIPSPPSLSFDLPSLSGGEVDTHSFTTSLAQFHMLAQRVLPR
ncbi:hypothetical protein EDD16DRAFT_1711916 [Pisolithus croceorrhizus]|nr:hypothetical protein EDD16DRAFT_1711916 [Pisolithus croceorrhizus]KAI6122956.1 hypothetical protein EV401DRAFT_2069748 [Pisolithus croceorrhizus]KAI6148200.1 hypothetical protein EDD17DRAFT_1766921 [Pisolithus thermaeus]